MRPRFPPSGITGPPGGPKKHAFCEVKRRVADCQACAYNPVVSKVSVMRRRDAHSGKWPWLRVAPGGAKPGPPKILNSMLHAISARLLTFLNAISSRILAAGRPLRISRGTRSETNSPKNRKRLYRVGHLHNLKASDEEALKSVGGMV